LKQTESQAIASNPGPSWGYQFLCWADRLLPAVVFDFLLGLGTWVAVLTMPVARRHSREYLNALLPRSATLTDVWRHFFAFAQSLALKLRVGEGRPYQCVAGPDVAPFAALMASGEPALLGTLHLGHSDLLGFMLSKFNRHAYMVRLRVGNSGDTLRLGRRFGSTITYLWVNEKSNLLFELKNAIQSGGTIAMKCDRPDFSSRLEPFEFLGRPRLFPFTIYHLSLLFRRPVVHCVSLPQGRNASLVRGSPVFTPDDGPAAENLRRARAHFQEFLRSVESLLREDPFLWGNFTPLNPALDGGPATIPSPGGA
jgi:predicted LPLAT superfamily acyltransferase